MLARHARDLLELLDDTPVQPGDAHPAFDKHEQAREILNAAEADLRGWTPDWENSTSHVEQPTTANTAAVAAAPAAAPITASEDTTTSAPTHVAETEPVEAAPTAVHA